MGGRGGEQKKKKKKTKQFCCAHSEQFATLLTVFHRRTTKHTSDSLARGWSQELPATQQRKETTHNKKLKRGELLCDKLAREGSVITVITTDVW